MPKAIWNGVILASSDQTRVIEGNHYFPPESLNREHFRPGNHTSVCGWKGTANYYDITADGQENTNAAWYYAAPKEAAASIAGYVAFWKGVQVEA